MIQELAELGQKIKASSTFNFDLFNEAYRVFFQTIFYECEDLEPKHIRMVSPQELKEISNGNYQKTLQKLHTLLSPEIRLNTTVRDLYETIQEDLSLAEKIRRSCFPIVGHYSRFYDICFITDYLLEIDAAGVLLHETVHRYVHHKRMSLNLEVITDYEEVYCGKLEESFVSFLKNDASFQPQQELEKLEIEIIPQFMYDLFCRNHVLEREERVIKDREQSLTKLLEKKKKYGLR